MSSGRLNSFVRSLPKKYRQPFLDKLSAVQKLRSTRILGRAPHPRFNVPEAKNPPAVAAFVAFHDEGGAAFTGASICSQSDYPSGKEGLETAEIRAAWAAYSASLGGPPGGTDVRFFATRDKDFVEGVKEFLIKGDEDPRKGICAQYNQKLPEGLR